MIFELFLICQPVGSAAWPRCSRTRAEASNPATGPLDARRRRPSGLVAQSAKHFARDERSESISASAAHNCGQGLSENAYVEPHRPILEVVEVQANEVVEGEARPAGDLPEAGHPRQDAVAPAVPVLEQQVVPHGEGTGADEAHLAPEDVEHLGDLVDREAPQRAADPRDAWIVADLEQRAADFVRTFELALLLGGAGDHRPELQHPELPLAEPDAAVAVEDRPGRRELDRERDQEPQGKADEDDESADGEVEPALDDPVGAGKGRLPQLEQRHTLSGDELGTLREQLCGPRRDPDLHARAMGLVAQPHELFRVEIRVGDDQLVDVVPLQDARQLVDVAEKRQIDPLLRRGDRTEELVLDYAAPRAQARVQAHQVLAGADEHRPAPQAGQPEDVARDDVVAHAQRADQNRREQERRREDRERREVVAGADPDREREQRYDGERRDDLADAAATLALGVQPLLPEDEREDQREERQPLRLGVAPDQSPENWPRAVDELAHRKRSVDAEREAAEVEHEQGRDARRPARDRLERPAGEEERPARTNVLGQRLRTRLAELWVELRGQAHDCTCRT